jgi:hypothetical protein
MGWLVRLIGLLITNVLCVGWGTVRCIRGGIGPGWGEGKKDLEGMMKDIILALHNSAALSLMLNLFLCSSLIITALHKTVLIQSFSINYLITLYMCINCARCGEQLTAPYWHDGKPYGYSCIKIVSPSVKKKKHREYWQLAESHNYNSQLTNKQHVIAVISGKKYRFLVLHDIDKQVNVSIDTHYSIIGHDNNIYINTAHFNK